MKVYWLSDSGWRWTEYIKKAHSKRVYRFQCWEDEGIIIAAPKESGCISHFNLNSLAQGIVPTSDPSGVGQVVAKNVIDWTSFHYQLITPKALQVKITEALGLKQNC